MAKTLAMVDEALARPLSREELLAAQKRYCEEKGYPHFAPYAGYCYHCKADIVTSGWANVLISGCNKCHMSFCD